MQEIIDFANLLADEARKIVREHFRTPFEIISKEDASPVTIADRGIEARLRELIEAKRPQDGIIGEEYGEKATQNDYRWIIDPIDGTKSFVIGRPTFGTLTALYNGETPVLGIIDQAINNERWLGVKGQETTFNGKPVRVRPCPDLAHACAASTTPAMFKHTGPVYEKFEERCSMMAWGGDCYMYGLLASGFMDLVVEASLSLYDYAALVPIVQGAGGIITDWNGTPPRLERKNNILACGDSMVHQAALELLR